MFFIICDGRVCSQGGPRLSLGHFTLNYPNLCSNYFCCVRILAGSLVSSFNFLIEQFQSRFILFLNIFWYNFTALEFLLPTAVGCQHPTTWFGAVIDTR